MDRRRWPGEDFRGEADHEEDDIYSRGVREAGAAALETGAASRLLLSICSVLPRAPLASQAVSHGPPRRHRTSTSAAAEVIGSTCPTPAAPVSWWACWFRIGQNCSGIPFLKPNLTWNRIYFSPDSASPFDVSLSLDSLYIKLIPLPCDKFFFGICNGQIGEGIVIVIVVVV